MRIGSLFSGCGGFEKGLEESIEGAKTIWQVEQDPFCQKVLKKHWPDTQLFDDVCKVGKHNLEPVDLICGGFPCQDLSVAGKGAGIYEGKKSNLWWEMYRIIGELRSRYVVIENVPVLNNRGLGDILVSLSNIGYDAEWRIISARDQGSPHLRKRIFIVAYTDSKHIKKQSRDSIGMESQFRSKYRTSQTTGVYQRNYWKSVPAPPSFCRVDDGIPNRLDRIKALGNAILPQVSAVVGTYINNHWRNYE